MGTKERLAIFPSRTNYVLIKSKITSAFRGLGLLKRKKDALDLMLREQRKELMGYQEKVGIYYDQAIFSLAKANFIGTDFKPAKIMDMKQPDAYVMQKYDRVMGIALPRYDLILHTPTSYPLTGLARGGRQVKIVRQRFQEALQIVTNTASLTYSVQILKTAVVSATTRHNGLEYVILPRLKNTLSYIATEFDEYEREDFYRLKRSQAKQKEAKERFNQILLKRKGELIVDKPKSKLRLPNIVDDFDPNVFDTSKHSKVKGSKTHEIADPLKTNRLKQTPYKTIDVGILTPKYLFEASEEDIKEVTNEEIEEQFPMEEFLNGTIQKDVEEILDLEEGNLEENEEEEEEEETDTDEDLQSTEQISKLWDYENQREKKVRKKKQEKEQTKSSTESEHIPGDEKTANKEANEADDESATSDTSKTKVDKNEK